MSSRKYTLALSDEAKLDLRDILSYTLQTWGELQFVEYGGVLDKALIFIAKNPKAGRNDYPPYRHVRAGSHCIFYRIQGEGVFVSRILHGKMDFKRHLDQPPA